MRKYILFLSILFVSSYSYSQLNFLNPGDNLPTGRIKLNANDQLLLDSVNALRGGLTVVNGKIVFVLDSIATHRINITAILAQLAAIPGKIGLRVYDSTGITGGKMLIFNGTKWVLIDTSSFGGGGGGIDQIARDTANAGIALARTKLSASDTSLAWWFTQFEGNLKLNITDTSYLHNQIILKLNISDTVGIHNQLALKLVIGDTANGWWFTQSEGNLKLNKSDSGTIYITPAGLNNGLASIIQENFGIGKRAYDSTNIGAGKLLIFDGDKWVLIDTSQVGGGSGSAVDQTARDTANAGIALARTKLSISDTTLGWWFTQSEGNLKLNVVDTSYLHNQIITKATNLAGDSTFNTLGISARGALFSAGINVFDISRFHSIVNIDSLIQFADSAVVDWTPLKTGVTTYGDQFTFRTQRRRATTSNVVRVGVPGLDFERIDDTSEGDTTYNNLRFTNAVDWTNWGYGIYFDTLAVWRGSITGAGLAGTQITYADLLSYLNTPVWYEYGSYHMSRYGTQYLLYPDRSTGSFSISNKVDDRQRLTPNSQGIAPHALLKIERGGIYNSFSESGINQKSDSTHSSYQTDDDLSVLQLRHQTNAIRSVQAASIQGLKIEVDLGGDQAGPYSPELTYGVGVGLINRTTDTVKYANGFRFRFDNLASGTIDTLTAFDITSNIISSGAINNYYGIRFKKQLVSYTHDYFPIIFEDSGKVNWMHDVTMRWNNTGEIGVDKNFRADTVKANYLTGNGSLLSGILLDGLSNVNTTGKNTGDILKWNGTAWVDSTDETGGGGGGHVIQDEGVGGLTQRDTLNFAGAGVTVTDAGGKTLVTIPGGGSTNATDGIWTSNDSLRILLRTNSSLLIESGTNATDSLAADSTGWIATDADVNGKEPTLTKGDLTATAPALISATRQVIGGAAIVSVDTVVLGTKADLNGKVGTTRAINTTAPITGGGNLTADRTIAADTAVLATQAGLNGKVPTTRTITGGDGVAPMGDLSADRTITVQLDFDGGLETTDDSVNIKVADGSLILSTSGVKVDSTSYPATDYDVSLKANKSTTITVVGTAPMISSAGAQDLSANRTWTISVDTSVLATQSDLNGISGASGTVKTVAESDGSPIVNTPDTLELNSTNLVVTNPTTKRASVNTIQDIATASNPQFNSIGLGVAGPDIYKFHFAGTTLVNSQGIFELNSNSAGAVSASLVFNRSRGSFASPTKISQSDQIGGIVFQEFDGNDFFVGAQIRAFADGIVGADSVPGRLVFGTTPDGTDAPVNRLTIDRNGWMKFGSGAPSYKFDFGTGQARFDTAYATTYLNLPIVDSAKYVRNGTGTILDTLSKGFSFSSISAADSIFLWHIPKSGLVLKSIRAVRRGGTSISINVTKDSVGTVRDLLAANYEATTALSSAGTVQFTTMTLGDTLKVAVRAISGTIDELFIQANFENTIQASGILSSSGDITAVTVTAPVTGGGTSGSVNIAVDTTVLATTAVANLKALKATTMTIAATAPLASSSGAQDLSTNRTWTVSADTSTANTGLATLYQAGLKKPKTEIIAYYGGGADSANTTSTAKFPLGVQRLAITVDSVHFIFRYLTTPAMTPTISYGTDINATGTSLGSYSSITTSHATSGVGYGTVIPAGNDVWVVWTTATTIPRRWAIIIWGHQ